MEQRIFLYSYLLLHKAIIAFLNMKDVINGALPQLRFGKINKATLAEINLAIYSTLKCE